MLITFKTISQKSFQMELEDDVKIADLKARISKEQGEEEFPLETMKLIYNGKVYGDEETVGAMSFDKTKFVVVMNPKRKPAPAPVPAKETTAPVEKAAPAAPAAEPSTSSAETRLQDVTTTTTATTPATTAPTPAEQPTEVPEEHKATVEAIMSMGYERPQVILALKAAFWNADRAVEYLITGIPAGAGAQEAQSSEDVEMGENISREEVEAFMDTPQFNELRQIVQENPSALPQILQEIQQLNPQLMGFIRDNQALFLERLNAPVENMEDVEEGEADQEVDNSQHVQQGAGGIGGGPRTVTIALSQEEVAAVERIKDMGFPEALVIEAFIACDRNEDLAINYILTHMENQYESGGQ